MTSVKLNGQNDYQYRIGKIKLNYFYMIGSAPLKKKKMCNRTQVYLRIFYLCKELIDLAVEIFGSWVNYNI